MSAHPGHPQARHIKTHLRGPLGWRAKARCVNADPLPVDFYATRLENQREAVKFCRACPVAKECFADAMRLDYREQHGIWGGTTEIERRRIKRGQPRL